MVAGAIMKFISAGMKTDYAIGSFLGGFWQGGVAKKAAKLQGQMAMQNAYGEYVTAQYNAGKIAEQAGGQEYSLYQQQKSHRATMETNLAANGVMLEGSAVDLMSEQAKYDAQNRDSLIQQSKNEQANYVFQGQQALQSGKNEAAYYKGMGKAEYWSSVLNGFSTAWSSIASAISDVGSGLMGMGGGGAGG